MNTCRYWVGSDTKGHRCPNPADARSGYCAKHYEIELARVKKQQEKQSASTARIEAAWVARNASKVPAWRVQLERAEAEYARRTTSPIDDRAAVGGDMHGSIVRAQRSHLSDSNVARVVELERIIKRLRADIARAAGGDA